MILENNAFQKYYRSPVDKKTSATHNDGWKNVSFVANAYDSGTYKYVSRTLHVSHEHQERHPTTLYDVHYYKNYYAKVYFSYNKYNALTSTSIFKWDSGWYDGGSGWGNNDGFHDYVGSWV